MNLDDIIIELLRIRGDHQRAAALCATRGEPNGLAQNVTAAERITTAILALDRAKPAIESAKN